MKIVTVIPLKKGAWKDNLTYFSSKDIGSGDIVTIAIRNKKILGLVAESEDAIDIKSNIKDLNFNLKKIIEIKESSIFLKEYLDSAIETSAYFAVNKSNGIGILIPSILKDEYDQIAKFINTETRLLKENLTSEPAKQEMMIFQASLEDRISSYKTIIRGAFAEKKSVFVVLPTEYDMRVFEETLSKGIEQFTFVVYSKSKKLKQKIGQIISTPHPVLVLGTAPFLSIPRHDFGTIILEHESSNAYKTIGKPHLDLRVFVEIFATKINAKLIFADILLRFETIGRQETDNLSPLHPLSFRVNFDGVIEVVNPKPLTEWKTSKFQILSNKSVEEIKNSLSKKQNVFIFSLRKGLATTTLCRDCGETVSCDKCGTPAVLYLSRDGKKRMFVCNKCETNMDPETRCKTCESWNLMPLGIGTDNVFEEAKKLFAETKIFKLDKDSVKEEKEAQKIIEEFEKSQGAILVGTEMAFSYLKNKIPLSIVASFDSLWSIPNFRISERIIQIALSMISRTKDKFIIQTKNENNEAILAIKSGNLLSFAREELEDRKKLGYPPFKKFIKIRHLGDKTETLKARKLLEENFKEYNPEIFSGFVAKLKGKYVTNALIKIERGKWVDKILLTKFLSLPVSFEVFVDPEDLL